MIHLSFGLWVVVTRVKRHVPKDRLAQAQVDLPTHLDGSMTKGRAWHIYRISSNPREEGVVTPLLPSSKGSWALIAPSLLCHKEKLNPFPFKSNRDELVSQKARDLHNFVFQKVRDWLLSILFERKRIILHHKSSCALNAAKHAI